MHGMTWFFGILWIGGDKRNPFLHVTLVQRNAGQAKFGLTKEFNRSQTKNSIDGGSEYFLVRVNWELC